MLAGYPMGVFSSAGQVARQARHDPFTSAVAAHDDLLFLTLQFLVHLTQEVS